MAKLAQQVTLPRKRNVVCASNAIISGAAEQALVCCYTFLQILAEMGSVKSNEETSVGHTCPTQNFAVILKHQVFDLNTNRLCSESDQLGDLA